MDFSGLCGLRYVRVWIARQVIVVVLALMVAPSLSQAATITLEQSGGDVTVHGDQFANSFYVYDAYSGGGPPYSVPTVVVTGAGGALASDESPDCDGVYDGGSGRLTITCADGVSLAVDLGAGNDTLYAGYDPATSEPVPEILGLDVSDGAGNDTVATYMQLFRFGSSGPERDLGLFDAMPLRIDAGLGKDTYELVTYTDPESGEETHAEQRIDASYADRPDESVPGQGAQILARVPGAPPSLEDPVTTTTGTGTYKNYQTQENDIFKGVFSFTGSQGPDLMYGDGGNTYPYELHGSAGNDQAYEFNNHHLRFYGDAGNDLFSVGYSFKSSPAPWLSRDTFIGGDGEDTITYQHIFEFGVRINPGTDDNGTELEESYIGEDVENFYGTPDPDQITGTDSANIILPWEGSDVIDAKGGDDTIEADDTRAYRDQIDCGAGDDWVSYDYRALSLEKKQPLDSLTDCETLEPAYDDNEDGCSSLDEGIVYGADAWSLDSDEDGRTNCEEIDGIDGRPPTNPIVPDTDSDGVLDGPDNCPVHYNPDQADGDGNGTGDACDFPPQEVPPPDINVLPAPVVNVAAPEVSIARYRRGICALQRLKIRARPDGSLMVRMRAKQARLVKVFVMRPGLRRYRWHRFRRRVEKRRGTTRRVGSNGVRALGMRPGKTYRLRVRVINEKPTCQARYRRQFRRLRVRIPEPSKSRSQ